MTHCPSSETLYRFIAGDFSVSTDSALERHVNQCKECQRFLESGIRKNTSPLLEIQLTDSELKSERSFPWPEITGFEIINLSCAGAQGFIYKARDLKLDRIVAVKLLRTHAFDEINRDSTVAREAKSIAQLDHPNIVQLLSMVETDQGPALILEWIEGGSLQDYLTGHTLTENEIIEIALKLTDALEHAHSRGILHRDIKPSNVLLRHGFTQQPMLCDFGLAKSKSGKSDFSSISIGVGTAGYMAPEMISRRFGRVTQTSDIYSLGALIYRMVAGVFPHQSENSFDTLERTCDRNVVAPSFFNKDLSWDLETICLKCLERDPEARYQSVTELKSDLQRLRSHEKITAYRMRWQRRFKTWCHEHPWIAGLSFSLFMVLFTGIFVLWNLLQQSRTSQQIAEMELVRTAETFRLSTPMIKRFLQVSPMTPNETRKIVKIAELLRDIGSGKHNLRQRFDLTYSGLEIATELFRVKDQQKLALTMADDARNSLSKLINEHGTELDRMAWLKSGDKIDISLLDQALVRYGHACIELSHMLQPDIATQAIAKNYLIEAIETAEKVIAKNPDVDEAYSDLANYYVELGSSNYEMGDVQEVSVTIKKALDIHERMLNIYPNDSGKMIFWLNCMDHALATEYEISGRSADFINMVNQVQNKMNDALKQNSPIWQVNWPLFLECLMKDIRSRYGKTDPTALLNQLNGLINHWHSMVKHQGLLSENLLRLMSMQIDKYMLIREIEGKPLADAYFQSILPFWNSPEVANDNRICQAILYMMTPDPKPEDLVRSQEILMSLAPSEKKVSIYREVCDSIISQKPLQNKANLRQTFFEMQLKIRDKFQSLLKPLDKQGLQNLSLQIASHELKKLTSIRDRRFLLDYLDKIQDQLVRK